MNIQYIGAGAGSGKTHTVTQKIGQALLDNSCQPAGLIATTYTKKAANELRQRLRAHLYEQGRPDLAARMDEALIGTVHSVCARILQQHAFTAGISPQLDVMDEQDAAIVLQQLTELVTPPATTRRMQELSAQFNQVDTQTKQLNWHGQLHDVLSEIRANDYPLAGLPAMAAATAAEYTALGGPPANDDLVDLVDSVDLDTLLLDRLQSTVNSLPGDGDNTKTTQTAIRDLERILNRAANAPIPWGDWIKLSKLSVAKKSEDLVLGLVEVAGRYPEHPRYQAELTEYITTVFTLSGKALHAFQNHKQERGLVDYSDLEQLTHQLLRDHAEVREACRAQTQLLVVDEFQDTSPLQMALFLKLAGCARETLWVGDVKQSIYGFRGSDPQLIDSAVNRLRDEGRLGEPLGNSWRTVPELVHLANELFVPAFQKSIQADPANVRLSPVRPLRKRSHPPLEFLHASTGGTTKKGEPRSLKKSTVAEAIAQRVAEILAHADQHLVGVKGTEGDDEQVRGLKPGDIAVLCRSKTFAREVADELGRRGHAVSLAAAGLMDTPEASLALACVRVLADRQDTLARAEILSWQSGRDLEDILAERIAHVAQLEKGQPDLWGVEGPTANEQLANLAAARERLILDAPSRILDTAMELGKVWETVSQWGPDPVRSGQRRANLETLRGLARTYEEACHSGHLPATVGGFLNWCDQLNRDQADNRAADPGDDAVQVATYHAAKGLEWPVVICAQLNHKPRDEWAKVQTVTTGDGAMDFEQPLANRTLHFWPAPFSLRSNDFGHLETIRNSPAAQRIRERAASEALRLLYVGITRARDRLILVTGDRMETVWLDALEADWLQPDDNQVALPNGETVPCVRHVVIPDADFGDPVEHAGANWFPQAAELTAKEPATRTPSGEAARPDARIGEVVNIAPRLDVTGDPDDATLGNVFHNFLACDLLNPGIADDVREEVATQLITANELADNLSAKTLLTCANRLREKISERFQPSRVLVEVPFHHVTPEGQSVTGFIDLLLETPDGWVLIDHKTFPGRSEDWEAKALSYSGQLACYRAAAAAAGIDINIDIRSAWIHFAVGGGLVEVI